MIGSPGEVNFPELKGAYGVRSTKLDVSRESNVCEHASSDTIGVVISFETVVGPQGAGWRGHTVRIQ